MNSPNKHNDTKMLLAVAGGVTVAAAVIVFFAAMNEHRDARISEVVKKPAASVARAAPPQLESEPEPVSFAKELENVEASVTFASYETVPPVPVAPAFEIDPHENFVARGLEAWHSREFTRAAAYFGAEVEERPDGSWTQYMLGLSEWKAGRLDEAVQALQRSADLDPTSIKAPINLSRVQNERGEYESALEAATVALAIDAQDARALFLSARSLSNLARTDEALDSLEQSISIDDANGHAHNLLGLIQLEAGQVEEALAAFGRAADLEPGIAYVRNNLGMALELNGDPVEALKAYRAAAELNPGHQKSRVNLARLETIVPASPEPDPELAVVVAEAVMTDEVIASFDLTNCRQGRTLNAHAANPAQPTADHGRRDHLARGRLLETRRTGGRQSSARQHGGSRHGRGTAPPALSASSWLVPQAGARGQPVGGTEVLSLGSRTHSGLRRDPAQAADALGGRDRIAGPTSCVRRSASSAGHRRARRSVRLLPRSRAGFPSPDGVGA